MGDFGAALRDTWTHTKVLHVPPHGSDRTAFRLTSGSATGWERLVRRLQTRAREEG